ncbi:MAG: TAXI family TRAP transporter solute-binding subunit [Thermomicrobiales bacterium]
MSRLRLVAIAVVAAILISGPGVGAQERLSIATGGTGGVYYPYGGAMANIISDGIEEVEVTAEVTAASVDNMLLIESRDADLAFVLADTAFDAVQGNAPFETAVPAVNLATLYNNFTHVVTTEDAGVETVADLAGKRVSTGSPGSGTEVIANRVLEAAGLNPDEDIEREQLGASESTDAMKDGQIDAYFWSGGLPTAAVTDLGATPNVNLKLLPNAELVDTLREAYGPFYGVGTIPAETYPNQNEDVEVVIVPNILVVHEEFDEELAYEILTVIFEQQPLLAETHPAANELTLENATQNSPLSYHPAALRFYEEQGVPVATPVASPAAGGS